MGWEKASTSSAWISRAFTCACGMGASRRRASRLMDAGRHWQPAAPAPRWPRGPPSKSWRRSGKPGSRTPWAGCPPSGATRRWWWRSRYRRRHATRWRGGKYTRGAMFKAMRQDIRTVLERDPAARSALEVVLCYPGVHAIWAHRVSHALWRAGWTTMARWLAHVSRFATGIEIHPAAQLGPGLFIDHGMGVVIGETDELGRNVSLLQGVTLGGTSNKRGKRHPTLGDNVVVGAGAKILGGFKIGAGSRIGAGSVVVREVPENSVVVGVPGRVTFRDGARSGIDLNQSDLPDPLARTLEQMVERIHALEAEIESLRQALKETSRT